VKKRQHYVWKHYLKEWAAQKEQPFCLRGDKIFPANVDNIAVERFFYKREELTKPDIVIISESEEDWHNNIENQMIPLSC